MGVQLPVQSCTGCGSCLKTCRFGAISMKEGEDGFSYPVIDSEKCVQCGQCLKACHASGDNQMLAPSRCYAAQIKDREILGVSSSGGIFYALAQGVLSEGGVVYGCVYDKQYRAAIARAERLSEITAMQGSKYVWSDPSQSFTDVKDDLERGKTVLYTGVPCQIAGLKRFLKKEYDSLYTVDVLCGGAPSPYAFKRYLETLTDENGLEKLAFQFRDKETYGAGVNCTYVVNGVKHHENYLENSFYFAFCSKSRITWRESCYSCPYKSVKRVSDMTIGDYWGVQNHHTTFKPKDGVSVILVNTGKGSTLFETISSSVTSEKSSVSFVTEKNSLVNEIHEGHVAVPAQRSAFFHVLRTQGWEAADKKYLQLRRKLLVRQALTAVPRKLFRMLKK